MTTQTHHWRVFCNVHARLRSPIPERTVVNDANDESRLPLQLNFYTHILPDLHNDLLLWQKQNKTQQISSFAMIF